MSIIKHLSRLGTLLTVLGLSAAALAGTASASTTSVKASRLSDGRGVMLVLPNREVWTFEALDEKVDLEDSVFLAGNDGPRRTAPDG